MENVSQQWGTSEAQCPGRHVYRIVGQICFSSKNAQENLELGGFGGAGDRVQKRGERRERAGAGARQAGGGRQAGGRRAGGGRSWGRRCRWATASPRRPLRPSRRCRLVVRLSLRGQPRRRSDQGTGGTWGARSQPEFGVCPGRRVDGSEASRAVFPGPHGCRGPQLHPLSPKRRPFPETPPPLSWPRSGREAVAGRASGHRGLCRGPRPASGQRRTTPTRPVSRGVAHPDWRPRHQLRLCESCPRQPGMCQEWRCDDLRR